MAEFLDSSWILTNPHHWCFMFGKTDAERETRWLSRFLSLIWTWDSRLQRTLIPFMLFCLLRCAITQLSLHVSSGMSQCVHPHRVGTVFMWVFLSGSSQYKSRHRQSRKRRGNSWIWPDPCLTSAVDCKLKEVHLPQNYREKQLVDRSILVCTHTHWLINSTNTDWAHIPFLWLPLGMKECHQETR